MDGLLEDPSGRFAWRLDCPLVPTGNELGASKYGCFGNDAGGELVSEPGTLTDLRADMGLVPRGPSPWKVDRLP